MLEKLRELVESMPENKNHSTDLRMSLAGDCPRKLEYDFVDGPGPISLEFYLKMESGRAIHELLQGLFKQAYGDDFHSMESEVSLPFMGGQMIGHPDGVMESLNAVVEIKSVSDATFSKISVENKPLDQHIEQANLYAFALRRPTCVVFYLNRESCELRVFVFDTSDEMATITMQKFHRVATNRLHKGIGDRPYSDKTESPCWYCHHKEKCYADFKFEVSNGLRGHIEDAIPYQMADGAWLAREKRLESEKIENKLKSDLGKYIHGLNMNEATVGDKYIVKLKSGKNDNLLTEIKVRKE